MINLLGAVIVVGASSTMGYLAGRNLNERCRLLKRWIWIVEILKTGIGIQARLLPEVLQGVAGLAEDAEIEKAFQELAATVTYGSALEFSNAWQRFMSHPAWRALKPPETAVLNDLGTFLGSTGREDQLAKLGASQIQLEQVCRQAESEALKRTGLYRYLGFAAGAMLVLWLG